MLSKVWNAHNISITKKLKLFNSIVMSVLIYECQAWKGLKDIETRVMLFEENSQDKMVQPRQPGGATEKDWSTIGNGGGQNPSVEMVWASSAYATIQTTKSSQRLDTLWKKEP